MKKVFFVVCFFFFFPQAFAYSAESMIAMDLSSGRVLYEQNAKKEKLIASTTKIMTTIVAIENMDLDTSITVDERVLKAYGSGIYIEIGEVLSLRDLLYGLMLRSGNDAAIVIACGVAGSMEGFVSLMNQKAYEIGMSQTKFYNAHGLEENNGVGNTSTAYDMALLMKYAMKNANFREITKTENYTAKSSTKTYHWTNKNKLLKTYPYTIGGKTGFTEKARRTLVTAAKKEDKEIAIVTLNDGNDFQDHENLYNVLFSQYHLVTVLKKKDFDIPDFSYYEKDELYLEKDIQILLTKEEEKDIHVTFEMNELESYHSQDIVGCVRVFLKNQELFSSKIYVNVIQLVKKESFLEKIFRWFHIW